MAYKLKITPVEYGGLADCYPWFQHFDQEVVRTKPQQQPYYYWINDVLKTYNCSLLFEEQILVFDSEEASLFVLKWS